MATGLTATSRRASPSQTHAATELTASAGRATGEGVSVVIPTTGRPSVITAAHSAAQQVGVPVELVIVFDAHEPALERTLMRRLHGVARGLVIAGTGGRRGAAFARHLGTGLATQPWTAYLDDDDTWDSDKLRRQLSAAAESPSDTVISCQVRSVSPGRRTIVVPRTPYADGDVVRYLFYRRRLAGDRNTIQTSTLVLPTAAAQEIGWRADLARHQDWDFVIRAVRECGLNLLQLPIPLVNLNVGSSASISASADWATSLRWVAEHPDWDRRARADFIAGQALRYACQSRDLGAVGRVLRELARTGRPTMSAVALGAAGLISRRTFEALMHRRTAGAEVPC